MSCNMSSCITLQYLWHTVCFHLQDYIKENYVHAPDGMEDGPPDYWFDGFRRRHPKLKLVNLDRLSHSEDVDSKLGLSLPSLGAYSRQGRWRCHRHKSRLITNRKICVGVMLQLQKFSRQL